MNIDLQSAPLLAASLLAVSLSAQALPDGEERILRKEILIQAPLDAVWRAWTTEEGLSSVSQKSNVELKLGGPFELFLQLDEHEGVDEIVEFKQTILRTPSADREA